MHQLYHSFSVELPSHTLESTKWPQLTLSSESFFRSAHKALTPPSFLTSFWFLCTEKETKKNITDEMLEKIVLWYSLQRQFKLFQTAHFTFILKGLSIGDFATFPVKMLSKIKLTVLLLMDVKCSENIERDYQVNSRRESERKAVSLYRLFQDTKTKIEKVNQTFSHFHQYTNNC